MQNDIKPMTVYSTQYNDAWLNATQHYATQNNDIQYSSKSENTQNNNKQYSFAKSHTVVHWADCHYAECHYAECHYAECHYADSRGATSTE
jgi:hypothetical protein